MIFIAIMERIPKVASLLLHITSNIHVVGKIKLGLSIVKRKDLVNHVHLNCASIMCLMILIPLDTNAAQI